MKLKHSKSWYAKNSEAEGDCEVGAGIPPWTRVRAGQAKDTVPAPMLYSTQPPMMLRESPPVHGRRALHKKLMPQVCKEVS